MLINEDIHHVTAKEKDRLILKGPNSTTDTFFMFLFDVIL